MSVVAHTLGLVSMLGQLGMMALIAFFLMASGDRFSRKMIKLTGPTLSKKRITLQALRLWGIWGLLLGVPILVVIKAVCDRVDDLKPVGEFLGV